MSQPTLSIILPTLNQAHMLPGALHALQPFRQRGVEIIVADGASADGTSQVARPFADQVINARYSRAARMNAGAKVAHGFIFLFLHPTTQLPPDADMQVMVGRERDTRVWGRFDLRIQGQHKLLPLLSQAINWRSRASGLALGEQAIFVRRETFLQIGGFPDLPVLEDLELCKRLRALSPPICVGSQVTVPGPRFDRDGFWKTLRDFAMMRVRYRMGADAKDLAESYGLSRFG